VADVVLPFVLFWVAAHAFALLVLAATESSQFWRDQEAFLRALDRAQTVEEVEALYAQGKALEKAASGFRAHAAGIQEASIAYRIKLETLRRRV
jgi:hypothetical protein